MEFGIENYVLQKRIRTFAEKENYKYFRILEADAMKQTEMKEKKWMGNLEEWESFSRPNSVVEISLKG